MFEKEAEEWRKSLPYEIDNDTFYNIVIPCMEFGYNKANEWHYVKDRKPKYNEYVLIYTDLKNTYVARIPTEKDYFITRRGGFVQMSAVIAWKEIVLPELPKETE